MATELYRNFVFHVVNSVKGGCGKSTFALELADFWANHDGGEKVYLIDLDTDGTSWEEDYHDCYPDSFSKESKVYLNDIIDNDKLHTHTNVWRKLDATKLYTDDNPSFTANVSICVADPKERKDTREYQVDLFEQAVIGLVEKDIISTNRWNDDDEIKKRVHIIFDMPPGAEQKSERILNRWLLSQSIRQKGYGKLTVDLKKEKKGITILPDGSKRFKLVNGSYEVRLYMMSTLANSSIAANRNYVEALLKPNSYYDVLKELCDNKAFSISFILNDITQLSKDCNNSVDELLPMYCKANYPLYIPKNSVPSSIDMKLFYYPFNDQNPGRKQHIHNVNGSDEKGQSFTLRKGTQSGYVAYDCNTGWENSGHSTTLEMLMNPNVGGC